MSKVLLSMVVVTVLGAGAAGPVCASEPAAQTVSEAALKPMTAAKQAVDAKLFDDAITEAGKVLAMPAKTPFDTFVAYQFLTLAYAQKNDVAKLLEAMQGQVDSGIPQSAERNKLISDMTGIAYESKNFVKTEEFGSQLINAGVADASAYGMVGFSQYQQGKNAEAAKALAEHVRILEASTKVPGEKALQVLLTAQEKSGDRGAVTDSLEKLINYYPKAEYWRLVLQSAARGVKLSDRQKLESYRLRLATESMNVCVEYLDMAETLVKVGMAGEAQKVLESGLASKLCVEKADRDALQSLLTTTSSAAVRAKAEMKDLETEAKASKTGELDVVLGSMQLGSADYARSAETLSRGVGKGGIKDMVDAQFLLGVAQVRAGDKVAAAQTFRDIKTDDPFSARLARLWVLQTR